jgi:hypothetical protein
MYCEPTNVSAADVARSTIQSHLSQYWKYALALLAINALNGFLFYVTLDSPWSRTFLSILGLSVGSFWACLNCPPRRYSYIDAINISFELGLASEWLLAAFSITSNLALGGILAMVWLFCIYKYVITTCLTSFESFASFTIGILLFAIWARIYPKAVSAECFLLFECDHVLREAGLRSKSKGKLYEITCAHCRDPYYTPEPLFTRGLCKQCYGKERFVVQWWVGKAALSIFVWQIGLRQLATHLVHDRVLRLIVWGILFFASSILWLPIVRRHWLGVFYWPSRRLNDPQTNVEAVPAPRLLVNSDGIKYENLRL